MAGIGAAALVLASGCAIDPQVDAIGSDLEPIHLAEPKYPSGGSEGCVAIVFTLGQDGRPDRASVIKSEPPGFFDVAALDALSHSRFGAKSKPGWHARFYEFRISSPGFAAPSSLCGAMPTYEQLNSQKAGP